MALLEQENKVRQFYLKASDTYDSNVYGNDSFEVYSELLSKIIIGSNIPAEEASLKNSVFNNVLIKWIKKEREFSLKELKTDVNNRYEKRKHRALYSFIFGIHIKLDSGTVFPFKHQFTINDTTFHIISKSIADKHTDGNLYKELHDIYSYQRHKNFWIHNVLHREYVYFKATINSFNNYVAANKVGNAFSLFSACVSLAQNVGRSTSGTAEHIASLRPIHDPYYLYDLSAENASTAILRLIGSDTKIQKCPLNITNDPQRLKLLKHYMAIVNKQRLNPIENRFKQVILEFNQSLDITDPDLRILSMWRCLEIATQLKDGDTRNYKDIINIIKKYHRNNDLINEKATLIMQARNNFVHRSKLVNYDSRNNYLKWIQDFTIVYIKLLLWMNQNNINTKNQINTFFNLYLMDNESLKISNQLIKSRQKTDKNKY